MADDVDGDEYEAVDALIMAFEAVIALARDTDPETGTLNDRDKLLRDLASRVVKELRKLVPATRSMS